MGKLSDDLLQTFTKKSVDEYKIYNDQNILTNKEHSFSVGYCCGAFEGIILTYNTLNDIIEISQKNAQKSTGIEKKKCEAQTKVLLAFQSILDKLLEDYAEDEEY